MIPVILHVPHASTVIPSECRADFVIDDAALRQHLAASTDHFTDELFALSGPGVTTVAFPISRLAVDPERFELDAQEPMAARGLGVLYERGHNGERIRAPLSAERRAWYLERWYLPHHAALEAAVERALASHGRALIIDCHSYPDTPLAVDLDKSTPRPSGCLGTSGIHTPRWLVDAGLGFAAQQGWTLGVDKPYAGTIIPMRYFDSDARVMSVMIEVNRKLYMTLDGDTARKSSGFEETRRIVQGLIAAMRAEATKRGAAERQPVISLSAFDCWFMKDPYPEEDDESEVDPDRGEIFEKMEASLPKSANPVGRLDDEIADRPCLSWEIEEHFYLLRLRAQKFEWALVRIHWDDNWGRYEWENDARGSGFKNADDAAYQLMKAVIKSWNMDEDAEDYEPYGALLDRLKRVAEKQATRKPRKRKAQRPRAGE